MGAHGVGPHDTLMLWVDAVGGYRVCLDDEIVIGQPAHAARVDVPLLADISPRHARIQRDGDAYLLEPLGDVTLDGRPVRGLTNLTDGQRIDLGRGAAIRFRRPHPLSASARLEFIGPHRMQPSADAVLLLADNCVLGPKSHSHVVCRDWPQEVLLFRYEGELFCRTAGVFEIDGTPCRDRGRIGSNSRVTGEGFSLSLEVLRERDSGI
jgi:hypothetical protein